MHSNQEDIWGRDLGKLFRAFPVACCYWVG